MCFVLVLINQNVHAKILNKDAGKHYTKTSAISTVSMLAQNIAVPDYSFKESLLALCFV